MDSHTQRAEALARHIAEDASLHGIVGAPLFMMLVCRAYIGGSSVEGPVLELPSTRVQLLEHCIETFDQDWEAQKPGRRFTHLQGELERGYAYEQVAWHFARKGLFGSFPRRELKQVLAQTPDNAGNLVTRIPESALADLPFLVPQSGRGASASWGFQVRILQEHFAARHLAKQEDPFEVIQPVLHHPAWRNVICLTAGLIEGEAGREAYIRQILEVGSEWDETLHRDLFLAAECLREAGLAAGNPVVKAVAGPLVSLARSVTAWKVPSAAKRALAALGSAADAQEMSRPSEVAKSAWRDSLFPLAPRFELADALGDSCPTATGQDSDRGYVPSHLAAYLFVAMALEHAATIHTEALVNALRHKCRYVRQAAAQELGRRGPAAGPQAGEWLSVAMRGEDEGVRQTAAEASCELGTAAIPQAVEALVNALRDDDRHVRSAAADALGALGPAASPQAVEPLVNAALRDEEPGVRSSAAHALGKLGPAAAQQAVESLVKGLRDRSRKAREAAAELLGWLGPAVAPQAVEPLVQALRAKSRKGREAAAEALGAWGPAAAAQTVPPLIDALSDEDRSVRRAAAEVLGRLGPAAAPQAVGPLIETFMNRENDGHVCWAAAEALGKLGLLAARHPGCLEALAERKHYYALDTLVALLEADKPAALPSG